jgi:hypothetical protein
MHKLAHVRHIVTFSQDHRNQILLNLTFYWPGILPGASVLLRETSAIQFSSLHFIPLSFLFQHFPVCNVSSILVPAFATPFYGHRFPTVSLASFSHFPVSCTVFYPEDGSSSCHRNISSCVPNCFPEDRSLHTRKYRCS